MKYRELCFEGGEMLAEAGTADPVNDARALLLAASGMDTGAYLMRAEEEIPAGEEALCRGFFGRRCRREPLQYILGKAPFYGRDFSVGPGVLIPRFDTETLVEALLPFLRNGMNVLDLCTGTGCILLTLLLEGRARQRGITGLGSDISETALAYARGNAARMGVENVSFVRSDLFSEIRGRFEIISANPPYIPEESIDLLDAEVRDHEPRTALSGGADGLEFYRRIIRDAPDHLKNGGVLGLEIGFDEGDAVQKLMRERGFEGTELFRDLAGLPRVVLGIWQD